MSKQFSRIGILSTFVLSTVTFAGVPCESEFEATEVATGEGITDVAAADLDNDGLPDLIVCDAILGQVRVYFAESDGKYSSPLIRAAPAPPQTVAIGDLNADDLLDFAVGVGAPLAMEDGDIAVFISAGDRLFQPGEFFSVEPGINALTFADLDSDNDLDAIVGNTVRSGMSVLQNAGDGTLGAEVPVTNAPFNAGVPFVDVVSGDFNDDGHTDIAMNIFFESILQVAFGDGSGGFASQISIPTGSGPASLTSADFNADGVPDLATVCQGPDVVSVFISRGDGSFEPADNYPTGSNPSRITSGDLNVDSHSDILVTTGGSGRYRVFVNQGQGDFEPTLNTLVGGLPANVEITDLNADGRNDFVIADVSLDTIDTYLSTCPCVADLAANDAVDNTDLAVLLAAWGTPGADFNADGTTNSTDLAILLAAWGPCP